MEKYLVESQDHNGEEEEGESEEEEEEENGVVEHGKVFSPPPAPVRGECSLFSNRWRY